MFIAGKLLAHTVLRPFLSWRQQSRIVSCTQAYDSLAMLHRSVKRGRDERYRSSRAGDRHSRSELSIRHESRSKREEKVSGRDRKHDSRRSASRDRKRSRRTPDRKRQRSRDRSRSADKATEKQDRGKASDKHKVEGKEAPKKRRKSPSSSSSSSSGSSSSSESESDSEKTRRKREKEKKSAAEAEAQAKSVLSATRALVCAQCWQILHAQLYIIHAIV